ncbi:MAG: fluoride efflux transporter CrcB, partial [bacterium]|nr:fluoride efflux transporter CrcB [bacterium]
MKILYIAAGGAIGALLRYGLAGLVQNHVSGIFPWGTLAVNLTGSFLIGFLWNLTDQVIIAPQIKTFVFIGILGAFTTFSTYMLETMHLFRDGENLQALGNLLISNLAGIVVIFSGFMLA